VPRFEQRHQATVSHEVLRPARLRLEAGERAVVKVGVLPTHREKAPLTLAGVGPKRVENAARDRDDRLAVGIGTAKKHQQLGRIET